MAATFSALPVSTRIQTDTAGDSRFTCESKGGCTAAMGGRGDGKSIGAPSSFANSLTSSAARSSFTNLSALRPAAAVASFNSSWSFS